MAAQRDRDRLRLQKQQPQSYRLAMKNTQPFSVSVDTIEQTQTSLAPQPHSGARGCPQESWTVAKSHVLFQLLWANDN